MRGLPRRILGLGRSVLASVRGATYAGSSRIANATRIAPSSPPPLPQKLWERGGRTDFWVIAFARRRERFFPVVVARRVSVAYAQ